MNSKLKKTLNVMIYTLVCAHLIAALLISFEMITINYINIAHTIVGKVSGTFSSILFILLIIEIITFIFRNENVFVQGKNIGLLLKKKNLKTILKLSLLIMPFILIKLIRYIYVTSFREKLPLSIQVTAITFIIMGIIILLIFIYVLIIYIFKKQWIIEENAEIDFDLWIETYDPQNFSNNECNEQIELVFDLLIKYFLGFIIKSIQQMFNFWKSKFIKIDRLRNVPPTN